MEQNRPRPKRGEVLAGELRNGKLSGEDLENIVLFLEGVSDEWLAALEIRKKIKDEEDKRVSIRDRHANTLPRLPKEERAEILRNIELIGFAFQVNDYLVPRAVLLEVGRQETSAYTMGGALRTMESFGEIKIDENNMVAPSDKLRKYLEEGHQ